MQVTRQTAKPKLKPGSLSKVQQNRSRSYRRSPGVVWEHVMPIRPRLPLCLRFRPTRDHKTMWNSSQATSESHSWTAWENLERSTATRTSARTAARATRRCRAWRNTSSCTAAVAAKRLSRRNHSPASTAERCTCRSAHWRCTSARTRYRASVRRVAKRSAGRGCYRVTSEPTPERNLTSVPHATGRLPTGRIFVHICRLTPRSRNIRALVARAPSPGCHCCSNTRTQCVWTSLPVEANTHTKKNKAVQKLRVSNTGNSILWYRQVDKVLACTSCFCFRRGRNISSGNFWNDACWELNKRFFATPTWVDRVEFSPSWGHVFTTPIQ